MSSVLTVIEYNQLTRISFNVEGLLDAVRGIEL